MGLQTGTETSRDFLERLDVPDLRGQRPEGAEDRYESLDFIEEGGPKWET